MSLRLLIDEDTQSKTLVTRLRQAGHDVLTVQEADLSGLPDADVLTYAISANRVLLTHNADEFRLLHQADDRHSGIIAIYRDNDPARNMSHAAISKALTNLEASDWELTGQFIALNAWNF